MYHKYENKFGETCSYRVEIPVTGLLKKNIQTLTCLINKIEVKTIGNYKIIPHVTIVGPLSTIYENKLAQVVKKAIQRHKTAGFQTNGFGIFCKNVFYVEIIPSKELIEIRNEIVNNLSNFFVILQNTITNKIGKHILP